MLLLVRLIGSGDGNDRDRIQKQQDTLAALRSRYHTEAKRGKGLPNHNGWDPILQHGNIRNIFFYHFNNLHCTFFFIAAGTGETNKQENINGNIEQVQTVDMALEGHGHTMGLGSCLSRRVNP